MDRKRCRRYLDSLYSPREAGRNSKHRGGKVAILALLLYVFSLLVAQAAMAQDGIQRQRAWEGCGQTRLVLVRFEDGEPAPGVTLTLGAVDVAGGPDPSGPETPGGPATVNDGHQDVVVSPLPTKGAGCTPLITGTLAATTNDAGLAIFEGLGEGNWVLRFGGQVTRAGRTAPVVPVRMQGLFPYGRTREGGGFVERVDALNEHGGPNPEPVEPGTGQTTSRYLLHYSVEHAGWLPGLDLAAGDDVPPVPLAAVTPVITVTERAPDKVIPGGSSSEDTGAGDNARRAGAAESAFDPSSLEVVPSGHQTTVQRDKETMAGSRFSAWWAVALFTATSVLLVIWKLRKARRARGDVA